MKNVARLFPLLLVLTITACNKAPSPFELADISDDTFGRDFALTDHHGQPRTLADFRGKVVVLFFGFTHCPDICPTTMIDLAQMMKQLGPDAARVQVLFVTVDPERDTQALLAKFVPSFNPGFLGLYGDAAATERVAKEFKIVYRKQPLSGDNYTVDHSPGTFVFDAGGRLRLFASYGKDGAPLLHDIRLLLQGA